LLGAGLGTATTGAAHPGSDEFPIVSMRGQLVSDGPISVRRKDGVSTTEYSVVGELPGYNSGGTPEELVVYVHGWRQSKDDVAFRFPKQIAAMKQAGIDGTFANFSWQSNQGRYNWWAAADASLDNGPMLASFLREFKRRSPETTVHVLGFSLGARTLPDAMITLDEWNWGDSIDTLTFLGAAVPEEDVSMEGRAGTAIERQADEVFNFVKQDDQTVKYGFGFAETARGLGTYGIGGTKPDNYTEIDITDESTTHNDLWKGKTGVMERIAAAWNGTYGAEDDAPARRRSQGRDRSDGTCRGLPRTKRVLNAAVQRIRKVTEHGDATPIQHILSVL
jgi:hypothetical protein